MCCGLFLFQIPLPTSLYVRQIPVELIFLCLAMSDLKSYVDVWWFWFVCLMPVLGTSSFSCVFKILISFPSPLQRYIVYPLKFTEIFLIFKIFLSFDSTVHIFSNISYTYLKEILLNAICGVEFFFKYLGKDTESICTALVGSQKGYLWQNILHNLRKNQENSVKY